jgi:hypothetical protein
VCSCTRTCRKQPRQLQRSHRTGGTATSGNGLCTCSAHAGSRKSHWKNDCNHEAPNCWRGPRPCQPYQSKRPRRSSTITNRSSRHSWFLLQSHSVHHGPYSNQSDNNELRSSERAHPGYSAALPLNLSVKLVLLLPRGVDLTLLNSIADASSRRTPIRSTQRDNARLW